MSKITCNGDPTKSYPHFKSLPQNEQFLYYDSVDQANLLNNSSPNSGLAITDYVVIIVYFFTVLFVGIWSMYRNKNRSSVKGYFLANSNMPWYAVGASLFASNIGSTHFIGLAGSGASTGWTVIAYEFSGMIVVLMLGYLFVPVYLSCNAKTMPEYLKIRFGRNRLNFIISAISLVVYIFTKISVDLYAGAIFIQQAMQIQDIWKPILILLLITAIFTIGGGLSAVIYTDTLQTVIMIFGGIYVAVVAFNRLENGYTDLVSEYLQANNTCWTENLEIQTQNQVEDYLDQCKAPKPDHFKLLKENSDDEFSWLGVLTGMTINSIWYWCSDQVIVQRVLAAKNINHAKLSTIFCSYLKISIIFIMVMPGMISKILFPFTVGCSDKEICRQFCHLDSCNDVAYPYLITRLLKPGFVGLMVSCMLSSLMSSLTSIFNSSSSIFTIDIWPKLRKSVCGGRSQKDMTQPKAISRKEFVIVSRLSVIILILISVCWIPIVMTNTTGSLFVYVQMVSSYFQPPICAVYIMGVFMPSINEMGCFYGLLTGLFLGTLRMVLDMLPVTKKIGCLDSFLGVEDPRLPILQKNFPFLIFGFFMFVVTILVAVIISKLLPENEDTLAAVTLQRRKLATWQGRIKYTYQRSSKTRIFTTESSKLKGNLGLENLKHDPEVNNNGHLPDPDDDPKVMPVLDSSLKLDQNSQKQSSLFYSFISFLCGYNLEDAQNLGASSKQASPKTSGENPEVEIDINPKFNVGVTKAMDLFIDANGIVCVMVSLFLWYWGGSEFICKKMAKFL